MKWSTRQPRVNAQAIPSYAPQNATPHFKKVECFCFKQQTLKAHEARQMPVVFFIDPALPKDVKTITLSYTFFEVVGGKQRHAKAKGRHGMNKQASFLYSMKAVLWSFSACAASAISTGRSGLNPLHIIIAALLAVPASSAY
jgi:hypothetical protein